MLPSRQKAQPSTNSKVLMQFSLNTFTPKKKENCQNFYNAFTNLSPLPMPIYCLNSIQTYYSGLASQMTIISTPMVELSQQKNNMMNQHDKELNLISRRMSFAQENASEEDRSESAESDDGYFMQYSSEQSQHPGGSQEFQEPKQRKNPQTPAQNNKKTRKSSQTQVPQKVEASTKTPCNCRKTKCLKLYCDCFRDGRVCGVDCNCQGCHNLQEYKQERVNIMQLLKKRNPQAFTQKISVQEKKHSKGCNCKKSGCLKKYCECYQAKLQCTQLCKCSGCKNCSYEKKDYHQDSLGATVKKQRKMVQI